MSQHDDEIRQHVERWWAAVSAPRLDALRSLTHPEIVISGMPGQRVEGWDELARQHADFTSRAAVDAWELSEWTQRVVGPTAVCSYRWRELGTMDGSPFALEGSATDVLVRAVGGNRGGWRSLARHVGP
jgi:ketosteroid isomerase-like protein